MSCGDTKLEFDYVNHRGYGRAISAGATHWGSKDYIGGYREDEVLWHQQHSHTCWLLAPIRHCLF